MGVTRAPLLLLLLYYWHNADIKLWVAAGVISGWVVHHFNKKCTKKMSNASINTKKQEGEEIGSQ